MNLDIKLLGKAIQCHGLDLVDKIKEEQQTEPSSSLMSYLDRRRPMETEEKNETFLDVVRSFIARKSDMLFKPIEPAGDRSKSDEQDNEDVADVYAIMPPLETFMGIPSSVRRDHFYHSLSKEDCVTGVVTSILDTGLLVRLLCVDVGPPRDMDGLDVMAYCPAKELPRLYANESALDAFQQNDIVRGIVLSVNPETERIILSLHEKSIPQEKSYPRIGLITEEDFPVHYRRKSEAANKDYEDILESVMGFNNVGNIKALVQQQGFTEIQSFTRSLSRMNIPKMEYAEGLNKWQSQKLAHQSVALGVGMFKEGKYTEAMQHFNKALQIDEENVEALVARGALFANKENFEKAVADFRQALSINATHSNARNYLIETLLTMGKLEEDARHLGEACQRYKQALEVDPEHLEAKDMLKGCQKLMVFQERSLGEGKSLKKTEGKGLIHSDDSDSDLDVDEKLKKKSAKAQSSASILSQSTEKLLQLIKEDESKMGSSSKKRKHKRSTDHSSPEKEEPKKKRKGRTSSRGEIATSSDSDFDERQKVKGVGMASSSPGASRVSSARIKDKAVDYQESNLVTARLQSPTRQTPAEIFLPFSSQRFFTNSTIPGLESPPLSDAKLEPGSPGVDSGRRAPLSRKDSYLMEQRKNFYDKEEVKSSSHRRKRQHSRSSSSSRSGSSSSSSSTSSSDTEIHKGKERRRRSESTSPVQRRGKRSSRRKSRSRSQSPSKPQNDSFKEKGGLKTRTGVAELDMYLGDRSADTTIMALLGYGSKSPRMPSSHSRKSRSRSKSPMKRVKRSRRSMSRSPVAHGRSDRSLSRSSGGNRQRRLDKESAASHGRRNSRSKSKSHDSGRHQPQHGSPKIGSRMSLERKIEENEKNRMREKDRLRVDGLGRDREVNEKGKREMQVEERKDLHGDPSRGFKEEVDKLHSRPFLPRVLRKPMMDDPGLARKTMSSKEYDAIMKEKRQKNEQRKASSQRDESRMGKKEARDRKLKDTEKDHDNDTKSSKGDWKELRSSRREYEEGFEKDDSEEKEYTLERTGKNKNDHTERGRYDDKSKSDQREKSMIDTRNNPRGEKHRFDRKSDQRERSKSDEKDILLKKTILMAPEDLEKEIERRVQERLKEEEKKEKEIKPKESLGEKKGEHLEDDLYLETTTGWTRDAYGKMYYALKGKKLSIGYTKDKFGKTYYVGPHPVTNELGESQKPFVFSPVTSKGTNADVEQFAKKLQQSSIAEAEKYKRKGRISISPKKEDLREREMSSERKSDYLEYGRPSLSRRKESAREVKDVSESRWGKSYEKTSETHSKNKIAQKASDPDNDYSKPGAFDSGRHKERRDDSHERDLPSTSSTSKESPQKRSRWDEENKSQDVKEDKKVTQNLEAKRKKISTESLTDLEKFLTSLKQRKKEQWIAEGKIKEKE